jgi:hypothetical protein
VRVQSRSARLIFSDRIHPVIGRRDAVWLIIGFFGARRHSEVTPTGQYVRTHEMGLYREDVTVYPDTHRVRLFIRRMKNDPDGEGHFVWLAGMTKSLVPIYDIMTAYLQDFDEQQPTTAPLVQGCPNGKFTGKPFQYRSRLKSYMKWIGIDDATIRDYSAHSLRRGGITRAYQVGVHYDLVNLHGSWRSGPAISGYRRPSPEQLVSVSARM